MDDPASQQTGEALAEALARGAVTVPGHRLDHPGPSVRLVGAGESYAAWLVEAGDDAVLFRFPRRPPEEMPAAMADEHAALQAVPPGMGTRAIAVVDSPDNPLGRRYLVTTHVPGDVVDGAAWTPAMVAAHTVQLARLHDATRRRPGTAGEVGRRPRDLAAEATHGYRQWCAAVPRVAEASSAGGLLRPLLRYLEERRWAFSGDTAHGLVHGDLVATNVVFDGAGTARYIDWEWAHDGDVAQDLALVGGRVHGGPWYVPMTSAEVEQEVRRYLDARRSPVAQGESLAALLARREAFEAHERYLSSLHFERVLRAQPERDRRYGAWVETLRSTLGNLLSTSEPLTGPAPAP